MVMAAQEFGSPGWPPESPGLEMAARGIILRAAALGSNGSRGNRIDSCRKGSTAM